MNAEAPRILLVVRHAGNARVLEQAITEVGMTAAHVDSEAEMMRLLSEPAPPGIALVDASGFGSHVWSLCDQLSEAAMPFVVMSAPKDHQASNRSLTHGAAKVLDKPVAKDALLNLLESLKR